MTSNATTSLIFTKANFKFGLSLVAAAILTACGGGGDSSSPASSSTSTTSPTLNLNAAFSKYTIGGSSRSGTISGYCQGTRVWNLAATYSGTTLNGTTPALIQNEYELDNMAPNSNAFCKDFYKNTDINKVKATNYYDPNTIVPITNGSNPPGTIYQNQVPLPTSVTAGSSATWFNTITLADGKIPAATSIQSWAVVADTSTTLTLITNNKAYTTVGNQLLFNQSTYYRINADNTLTALRKNIMATELVIGLVTGTTPSGGDQNIDEVYQQSFSSPTLNLNAAYTTQVKGGSTITGTIFGYCQGTRKQTFTPTVSGQTLSGAAALITNETETDSIPTSSNEFCKSFYSYNGSTSTPYYFNPTNVTPISSGATQNGSPLGLVWSNQSAPPSSVTTGATGTLATYVNYTSNPINSSGPTIPVEYGGRTWKIVPDSATTLLYIATDVAKVSGTDVVIYTSTTTYRINVNNTLTALYKEVQASTLATKDGFQTIYETYKQ